jgi:hypothetical protein
MNKYENESDDDENESKNELNPSDLAENLQDAEISDSEVSIFEFIFPFIYLNVL